MRPVERLRVRGELPDPARRGERPPLPVRVPEVSQWTTFRRRRRACPLRTAQWGIAAHCPDNGVCGFDRRPDARALVEAGIALSSELSLDAVLQKLTETAATLDRRPLRRARRSRPERAAPRALHDNGDRRDRAAAIGACRPAAGSSARYRRPARFGSTAWPRPPLHRLPVGPSADDDVPRRADRAAGRRVRQPLPDREGRRRGVHPRRRRGRRHARRPGGGGDRERAPVRVGVRGRRSSSR